MPLKNLLSLHEAIVVALINQPSRTASFEQLAKFIESRNLYPERKGNIPLANQVMLRSTKANGAYEHLFEQIGSDYIRLRDSYADFPLTLYSVLEEILEPFKYFFFPQLKKINVFDPEWGEHRKIDLSPKNIICITSMLRQKTIYAYAPGLNGEKIIKKYTIQHSLEEILNVIDPMSHHLVIISKDKIVNVAYFSLTSQRILKSNIDDLLNGEWPIFKFATSKKAKEYFESFILVQNKFGNLTLLQKWVENYKSTLGMV